jgi:DNA-binding beta-propeller fold protein YncE
MTRLLRYLGAIVAAATLMSLALAAPAGAADRVYWGNEDAERISFASLAGGEGGDLSIAGGLVEYPEGLAIDSVAGRIYWTEYGSAHEGVYSANLDGTAATALNTAGATVNSIYGLAIDPLGGRAYWGNAPAGPDAISFARLDGTGGADINTTGATPTDNPLGVAVDPGLGRIYFASLGNVVSYANLDGSGGGDINTTGATVSSPVGIAVDPAAGRVYWANSIVQAISFANLDGSGGADINTTGATLANPAGVAIDPGAGLIYWANEEGGGGISFARLDGSGGGDLDTTGASPGGATFPVLHKAPAPAGAPSLSVSPSRRSTLSCTGGAWAPDLLGSFLYRAPRTFFYRWSRDGAPIAGALTSTYSPKEVGVHRCTVTAVNAAGTTSQTSAPEAIETATVRGLRVRPGRLVAAAKGPSAVAGAARRPGARVSFRLNEGARVVFRIKRKRKGRAARALPGRIVRPGVAGRNSFRLTGRLKGRKLKPGRYLLTARARGVGKPGPTRSAGFRVKGT